MSITEMREILRLIETPDFYFYIHGTMMQGIYLQGEYNEQDIITNEVERQKTRKWVLSVHMTKSELVQTAFKCYLTSMEHRAREHFKYKNKRIFGPHFNIDALAGICNQLDYRPPNAQETSSQDDCLSCC